MIPGCRPTSKFVDTFKVFCVRFRVRKVIGRSLWLVYANGGFSETYPHRPSQGEVARDFREWRKAL